jgi:hypothetical protein
MQQACALRRSSLLRRLRRSTAALSACCVLVSSLHAVDKPILNLWPQAAGPNGTWQVAVKGREIADEDRSRTDGWEINAFFASPIVLGDKLYLSVMLGITYVIDTKAPVLDAKALIAVNDLGPLGDTWSLSGPSFAEGVLYHRSAKELVAIEGK